MVRCGGNDGSLAGWSFPLGCQASGSLADVTPNSLLLPPAQLLLLQPPLVPGKPWDLLWRSQPSCCSWIQNEPAPLLPALSPLRLSPSPTLTLPCCCVSIPLATLGAPRPCRLKALLPTAKPQPPGVPATMSQRWA